ncbi:hypothetical protein [uncultured Roseibium sp.]|uniref:hypothetical protein n=1 Tax=uncultured Roseibium sp. TaxID=1936171 RepID=UPI0032163775
MAKQPVLDLNTLIDRPKINIDGKAFDLYSAEELSILDSQWFTVKGQEIEAAAGKDNQEEVEGLVSEVCRRCLVACPDEVFDRLSGSHKMAIAELFTRLLLQRKTRVAGAIAQMVLESRKKTPATPTGASSSPGSSASSAAIRTGGSAKRRPRS